MNDRQPHPAWLMAFALGAAIGAAAGAGTHSGWLGVVAGLVPVWLTAIAFAVSTDRTNRLLRLERSAAETRAMLDVLREDP